ncbi:MAG TPA: polysaccharide biosynthesis tyrosine autokinase [Gemmatimonadales bacterium]|nr:polysaccharide biosynthesis tyrosine autokinase [Gemmatimonadales bacterium]
MDHSLTPSHQPAPSLLPTPTPIPTPSAGGGRVAGEAHDLLGILHRNVWWIVGCSVVCLTAALLYVALVRPSYTAAASVRIDDRREQDQAPGLSALGLTGGNEVNTEIEMLRSRMLAQAVVDSLGLQLRLSAPRWATRDRALVVRHVDHDAPASIYSLRPEGRDGFTLRNDSTGKTLGHVVPGADLPIPGLDVALSAYAQGLGTITFRVANYDDAVFALQRGLTIARRNRDANIVDVTYAGTDPRLVQAVPNLLVARFIADRQNTQQGQNRGLVGFLRDQTTRIAGQLQLAEDSLRRYRVAAHIVSLPEQARTGVSGVAALQAQRNDLDAERKALAQLLQATADSSADSAAPTPIAFPTLLRNQVAATLLGSLADAENRRSDLLSRRSPQDKDVQILSRRIADLRGQLQGIAATYLRGLTDQIGAIDSTLSRSAADLQTIPTKEIRVAELERNVSGLEQIYTLLQSRLKEAEIAQVARDPSVRQIDTAILPRKPVTPKRGLTLALALMVGLILGVSGALTREYVDRAVHTRRDVIAVTGVPVLAVIPHGEAEDERKRLPDLVYKRGRATGTGDGNGEGGRAFAPGSSAEIVEAFVRLSTSLSMVQPDRALKVLLVTSALPGEGKTTSAVNLALTSAWRGKKVLLVDADLRRGMIHRLFRLPRAPGLGEVLAGAPLDEAVHRVEVGRGPEFYVLTTGALVPDASQLVGTADLGGLLDRLRQRYDQVIIDSSPINVVSDGTQLATACDGVIVVARAGVTVPESLDYTLEQLRQLRVAVVGTVLNDIDQRRDPAYREAYQYHDSYLAAQSG